jgi:hypothetical protein
MIYKAIVKDRETKMFITIESEYSKKSNFIRDLKNSGYIVNPLKIKPCQVFDYIMNHTNCNPEDWKINKLP